jgi:carbon monoxide dehydrogenase subunit G
MAATPISVEAQRDGGVLRLRATAWLDASPEVVWNVLTDYEGQSRFVPGLTESRVVSHDAAGSVVIQKGWVQFLFLRFDFDVEYITRERPPRLLTSRVIRGNVKRMTSEYHLLPDAGGTRLAYTGVVEPEDWLPPLIGPLMIRRNVEAQIGAMMKEIERRWRDGARP